MLGVLGGMGPLATVDFLRKIIELTAADKDQHHIPMVVWSVPQVPDRSNHIIYGSESPFPELRKGALALQSSGASVIAMPCNTAHFWHNDLVNDTGIKILHIADAVAHEASQIPFTIKSIGILATAGTVKSGIYQNKLTQEGWNTILPSEKDQNKVMEGINLAKSGKTTQAREIFLHQIKTLRNKGADAIVLGCTELPAVLDQDPTLIDSNKALAKRCVRWFNATYHGKIHLPSHKETNSASVPIRI